MGNGIHIDRGIKAFAATEGTGVGRGGGVGGRGGWRSVEVKGLKHGGVNEYRFLFIKSW
jgi:hypothetical protein